MIDKDGLHLVSAGQTTLIPYLKRATDDNQELRYFNIYTSNMDSDGYIEIKSPDLSDRLRYGKNVSVDKYGVHTIGENWVLLSNYEGIKSIRIKKNTKLCLKHLMDTQTKGHYPLAPNPNELYDILGVSIVGNYYTFADEGHTPHPIWNSQRIVIWYEDSNENIDYKKKVLIEFRNSIKKESLSNLLLLF